jgi:hypothetical protein
MRMLTKYFVYAYLLLIPSENPIADPGVDAAAGVEDKVLPNVPSLLNVAVDNKIGNKFSMQPSHLLTLSFKIFNEMPQLKIKRPTARLLKANLLSVTLESHATVATKACQGGCRCADGVVGEAIGGQPAPTAVNNRAPSRKALERPAAADGQLVSPKDGTPAPTLSRRFQVRGANGYRY